MAVSWAVSAGEEMSTYHLSIPMRNTRMDVLLHIKETSRILQFRTLLREIRMILM